MQDHVKHENDLVTITPHQRVAGVHEFGEGLQPYRADTRADGSRRKLYSAARYARLEDALNAEYETEAMVFPYYTAPADSDDLSEAVACRLTIQATAPGQPVRAAYVALPLDADLPGHTKRSDPEGDYYLPGGQDGAAAHAEYLRVRALLDADSEILRHAALYMTRGGWRLWFALDRPIVVHSGDEFDEHVGDRMRWLGARLREYTGIEADPNTMRFGTGFKAPWIKRDGEHQRWPGHAGVLPRISAIKIGRKRDPAVVERERLEAEAAAAGRGWRNQQRTVRARGTDVDRDEIRERYCDRVVAKHGGVGQGGRVETLKTVVAALLHLGCDDSSAMYYCERWNDTLPDPLPVRELHDQASGMMRRYGISRGDTLDRILEERAARQERQRSEVIRHTRAAHAAGIAPEPEDLAELVADVAEQVPVIDEEEEIALATGSRIPEIARRHVAPYQPVLSSRGEPAVDALIAWRAQQEEAGTLDADTADRLDATLRALTFNADCTSFFSEVTPEGAPFLTPRRSKHWASYNHQGVEAREWCDRFTAGEWAGGSFRMLVREVPADSIGDSMARHSGLADMWRRHAAACGVKAWHRISSITNPRHWEAEDGSTVWSVDMAIFAWIPDGEEHTWAAAVDGHEDIAADERIDAYTLDAIVCEWAAAGDWLARAELAGEILACHGTKTKSSSREWAARMAPDRPDGNTATGIVYNQRALRRLTKNHPEQAIYQIREAQRLYQAHLDNPTRLPVRLTDIERSGKRWVVAPGAPAYPVSVLRDLELLCLAAGVADTPRAGPARMTARE